MRVGKRMLGRGESKVRPMPSLDAISLGEQVLTSWQGGRASLDGTRSASTLVNGEESADLDTVEGLRKEVLRLRASAHSRPPAEVGTDRRPSSSKWPP